jgi:hypothetical protein
MINQERPLPAFAPAAKSSEQQHQDVTPSAVVEPATNSTSPHLQPLAVEAALQQPAERRMTRVQ